MNNSVYGKTMNNLREKSESYKNHKNMSANQVLLHRRYLANNLMLFI